MVKELRINFVELCASLSHPQRGFFQLRDKISWFDWGGVKEYFSPCGHSKYSNRYPNPRKVAILFQFIDALGFIDCLSG